MRIELIILIQLLSIASYCQVSLEKVALPASVVFDMSSQSKGFGAPYMNSTKRNEINNLPTIAPPNGLFVYDNEENRFYYFSKNSNGYISGKWGSWVGLVTQNDFFELENSLTDSINDYISKENAVFAFLSNYTRNLTWSTISDAFINSCLNGSINHTYDNLNTIYIKGYITKDISIPCASSFLFQLPDTSYDEQRATMAVYVQQSYLGAPACGSTIFHNPFFVKVTLKHNGMVEFDKDRFNDAISELITCPSYNIYFDVFFKKH